MCILKLFLDSYQYVADGLRASLELLIILATTTGGKIIRVGVGKKN